MKRQPIHNQTVSDMIALYEHCQNETETLMLNEFVFVELISHFEKEKQYDKAMEVVTTAIGQYKYRTEFYIIKAKLHLLENNFEQALSCITLAEGLNSGDLEIKLIRVQILAFMGNIDNSISLVNELASKVTKEELSLVYLTESYIYEHMSDNEAIYNILYKAAVLDPLNEDILNRLWKSIQNSRFYYKGIKLYKRLIDIQPFSYLAWYHLGNAYIYVGEYEKAIDAMEYSFLIKDDFEEGYMEFAELCIQEGQYKKALDSYFDVLNLIGEDVDLIASIGNCYYLLGKHDLANKYFQDAIRIDNFNDHIFFLKAKNSLAAKNPKSAIESLYLAIDIDDNVEEYYYFMAKAYRMNGEIANALKYYKKAAKICPEQSFFWKKYVSYLINLKLYDKAILAIENSAEYTYEVDLDYYNAVTHMLKNDKKQGIVLLEKALKENFDKYKLIFKFNKSLKDDKEVTALIKYYYRELNPIYK